MIYIKLFIYSSISRKFFRTQFKVVIEQAKTLNVKAVSLYQPIFLDKFYFSWFAGDVLSFKFSNCFCFITSYGVNHIYLWSRKSKKKLATVNDIFYTNGFEKSMIPYIKNDRDLQLIFDDKHPLYFADILYSPIWVLSICSNYFVSSSETNCLEKEVLLSFDLINASNEASSSFKHFL